MASLVRGRLQVTQQETSVCGRDGRPASPTRIRRRHRRCGGRSDVTCAGRNRSAMIFDRGTFDDADVIGG